MERTATETGEGLRIVGAGVDSLYLAYRVRPSWSVVRALEVAKLRAGAARRAATDPRTGEILEQVEPARITLGGVSLDVRPYGASSAPYLLHADQLVQVAVQPEPMGGAPAVQVKCLAAALWRDGAPALVRLADAIARDIGTPEHELVRGDDTERPLVDTWRYVQRVDVAVDFQGWVPKVSDFELFCANGAPTRELHPIEPLEETLEAPRMWARWKLSGFRFGKTSIVLRLYDKLAEIAVSGKEWFRRVWHRSGVYEAGEPVWRNEIQLPRSYLKTVRTDGGEPLETLEEVLAQLAPMWRTVLLERVRLTNGDSERLDRASTRAEWETLALTEEIDGVLDGGRVTRLEQDTISAEALVPKIRGYMAKYGALVGKPSLDDVFLDAHEKVETLCIEREERFEDLVTKKQVARIEAEVRRAEMDLRAAETRARRALETERLEHELAAGS